MENIHATFISLKNKGILLNIITLGLSERAVEVLEGKKSESV